MSRSICCSLLKIWFRDLSNERIRQAGMITIRMSGFDSELIHDAQTNPEIIAFQRDLAALLCSRFFSVALPDLAISFQDSSTSSPWPWLSVLPRQREALPLLGGCRRHALLCPTSAPACTPGSTFSVGMNIFIFALFNVFTTNCSTIARKVWNLM